MNYRILYRCRECGETFSDSSMPERMGIMEFAKLCGSPDASAINPISMHHHNQPHQAPGIYRADFLGLAPEKP